MQNVALSQSRDTQFVAPRSQTQLRKLGNVLCSLDCNHDWLPIKQDSVNSGLSRDLTQTVAGSPALRVNTGGATSNFRGGYMLPNQFGHLGAGEHFSSEQRTRDGADGIPTAADNLQYPIAA